MTASSDAYRPGRGEDFLATDRDVHIENIDGALTPGACGPAPLADLGMPQSQTGPAAMAATIPPG